MSEETFRARPEATTRSYELIWKDNIPTVRPSNWAPGYTPGHMATVDEAVKYGMHRLQKDLANMREQWVNLNTLAMSLAADDMDQADAVKAATVPEEADLVDEESDPLYREPHTEQVDHGGYEDH